MRILCLLLILSALFPAFAGGTAEIDSDTRIVEDVWNREVEIPSEVDSIIAIGSMGPRMAAYLDVIDMLVGAEDSDKAAVSARYDYSPAYHEELASLPSVGRGGGSGENNAYAEETDLRTRTDGVPAEDKPRAYTGAVTFNGRHGFAFTYVSFPPFDAINALNVADTLLEEQVGEAVSQARESGTAYIGNDGFEVDPEMVMEWDPDIIFLDPGNMDLVNAEYAANPSYFRSLRAVCDGEVYTMPSTNSAGPNITYLLMNAYYAGTVLLPDEFSDIDFRSKASEIMQVMLGYDSFREMEAAGLYYGRITIGE